MMIYDNKSFEGLILSQVQREYFIADTTVYYSKKFQKDFESFNLHPFLKRGDSTIKDNENLINQ